ncbi:Retrotransposon gag protein [Corchorus capsularis]|uniref:Retrotransposon gag protein n=1 Tax=Corchorus capsularis TaxID=210143 RepID=A0A1R3K6I2_COCAP|nr:Retrotransposon gag protein [Corchorus capsularis]
MEDQAREIQQLKEEMMRLDEEARRREEATNAKIERMMEMMAAMTNTVPGSSGTANGQRQTTEAENVPSTGVIGSSVQVNLPNCSTSQINLPIPPGRYVHPNMSSATFETSPPTVLPPSQGANTVHVSGFEGVPVVSTGVKAEHDPRKMIEESTQQLWSRMEEKLKGLMGNQTYFKGVDKRSLTGSSYKWYNRLDSSQIKTWNDMANAFIAQYKYIDELAPSCETLLSMKRKPDETIKEYGQRFKDMALEVDPHMKDSEIGSKLLQTLPKEYYRELYQAATDSFTRLMVAGEAYEVGNRKGVFGDVEKKGHANQKKKEGEVHEVEQSSFRLRNKGHQYYPRSPHNYAYPYQYQPYGYYTPPQQDPNLYQYLGNVNAVGGASFQPKPSYPNPAKPLQPTISSGANNSVKIPIDPIPYTYTELLPQLLQQKLLERIPFAQSLPLERRPKWYKADAHCDYHSGTEGHTTEDCMRLKYAVQDLVRSGKLSFGNVAQVNPLPDHGKTQANMVETGEIIKRKVSEITTPLSTLFKALVKVGMIEIGEFGDGDLEKVCPYHGTVHQVCECPKFKGRVQRLMDERQIELYVEKPVKGVSMIVKEQSQPFVSIPSMKEQAIQGLSTEAPTPMQQRSVASVVVSSLQSLSYTNNHQVSKKHEPSFFTLSREGSSTIVTGVGQMTEDGKMDLQGNDRVVRKVNEESQGSVTSVEVENLPKEDECIGLAGWFQEL